MRLSALCSLFIATIFFSFLAKAEALDGLHANQSRGFSIGYSVASIANNLGTGITVGSPSFFNGTTRIVATGHLAWITGIENTDQAVSKWFANGLYKVGFASGSFAYQLPIRVYGSAEFVILQAHPEISKDKVKLGSHGSLGVELFMDPKRSNAVYVELGGMGLFAPIAEKLKHKPSVANGFTTAFGYRHFF